MFVLLLSSMAPLSVQPAPNLAPPAVQMIQPPNAGRIQLLPDLVVKDIRKDGPSGVRVLIANDGPADELQSFLVTASASFRSRHGSARIMSAGPLKAGETQWLNVTAFYPDGESGYPGKPLSQLTDWETVVVSADVYVAAPWSDGSPASLNPVRTHCTMERGCISEANETNNDLSMPVASMADAPAG